MQRMKDVAPGKLPGLGGGGGGGGGLRGFDMGQPMRGEFHDLMRGSFGRPTRDRVLRPTSGLARVPKLAGQLGKLGDLPNMLNLPFPWEYPDRDPWATVGPSGWNVPAGWTKCATPSCDGPVDYGVWSATTGCVGLAACPVGQAGGVWPTTRLPWGTVHASRLNVTAYEWTSGNFNDATFRGTIHAQFVRSSASVTTMPSYSTGKALPLPKLDPLLRTASMVVPKTLTGDAPPATPGSSGGAGASGSWMDEPAPDSSVKPAKQYEFPPVKPRVIRYRSTDPSAPPRRPPPQVPKDVDHHERPDESFKIRRVPKALVAALRLFHSATELQDAVDALVDAMGGDTRWSLAKKLQWLADNWLRLKEPMVFRQAVRNLLANEFEDRVLGTLLGSNWRTGVETFNDNYGTSVYVDTSIGGLSGVRNYMTPM